MASRPALHITPRLDRPRQVGIGVIAPYDLALDRELWDLTPANVSVHITRTAYLDVPVGVDQAAQLADYAATGAAATTLRKLNPQATVYLCTSGSFVGGLDGEARVRATIEDAGAGHAVTASGALLEALRDLGIGRLGVGTPYDEALTASLEDFLDASDVELTSLAYLGLSGDIPWVGADTVRELAFAAADGADAVFLACTNLPTVDMIAQLEHELGKPVLSATLVSMWSALRYVGAAPQGRPEQLFTRTGPGVSERAS